MRKILSGLALIVALGTPIKTQAIIDGQGYVRSGGYIIETCNYKGHHLTAKCEYDKKSGGLYCFASSVRDSKGKEVDIRTLNPSRLLELDPNTNTCHDTEDPEFLCC